MKRVPLTLALYLLVATGAVPLSVRLSAEEPDRTTLPIIEPLREPTTTLNVRKATPPARFEVKAPQDATNVLLVLIDVVLSRTSYAIRRNRVPQKKESLQSTLEKCSRITNCRPAI